MSRTLQRTRTMSSLFEDDTSSDKQASTSAQAGPSSIQRTPSDFFLQLAGALPDLASAPPREGQLTVDELQQCGVKVRDFAFATGVPPIVANHPRLPANHPVLRKQFQPDPHTEPMKRSSAEAKNEPTSKPQTKRSRLQREDTEPAIDEIPSQSQGNFQREVTPPQMYGVVGGSTLPARAISRSPSPWVPTPRASPSPPPTSFSGNYLTDAQSASLAAISQPMDSQALSEQSQMYFEFSGVPPYADDACPSTRSSPGAASGSNNFAGPSTQRDDSELVAGSNMDDDSMDVDVVPSDTAPPEMSSSYPPPTAAPLGPATRRSRPAKQLSPRRYNLRRRPISSSPPLKARTGTQARTASPGSSPLPRPSTRHPRTSAGMRDWVSPSEEVEARRALAARNLIMGYKRRSPVHLSFRARAMSESQFTISLLPIALSLVRIPRSRLSQLSHPVLRQILHPNPTFLNITCNEIELSLFAEGNMLKDFEPLARHDRQRRQRSGSGSGSSRKRALQPQDLVEISIDRWNVLQIDSHSDQLDNSGARVNELSAPIAAAGISILYQSSYMSDFIIVKESRLAEVMNLFSVAGFDLYSTCPPESPMLSPITSPSLDDTHAADKHSTGAVLTRTRSNVDGASTAPSRSSSLDNDHESSRKSHSPVNGDVKVLGEDLTCIGLVDSEVESWALKIIKLVAFPDLIQLPSQDSAATPHPQDRPLTPSTPLFEDADPFFSSSHSAPSDDSSSSSDEDGYFSHSPGGEHSSSSSSATSASASRSSTDLTSIREPSHLTSASKHVVSSLTPLTSLNADTPRATPFPSSSKRSTVSFFSFTRSPEGSSLTAGSDLLAALFPPAERHMVLCGGELDAADARAAGQPALEDDNDADDSACLKCLQIDLRRFGLDKHGIINRYSRILEEHGINHMYSSTSHTANLLVSKRHANRAAAVLRGC
ncbi:hypothetical protein EV121DRAFT_277077 [Schizophyllum commune]